LDLFITHTPSHILIALNWIRAVGNIDSSEILLLADFPGAEGVMERIRQGPINSLGLTAIPSYVGIPAARSGVDLLRRLHHVVISKKVERKAWEYLQNRAYKRVFVFNDTRHETQALMGKLFSHGSREFTYLDEGFASYRELPIGERIRALRLLFGPHWYPLRSFGTHPLIQSAYLLFPEYAHDELSHKNIHKMPEYCLTQDETDHFLRAFSRGAIPSLASVNEKILFVFLPHSDMVSSQASMVQWLGRLADACKEKGWGLVIKSHPRDESLPIIQASSHQCLEVVEPTIPGELLIAKYRSRIQHVFAEASSILLTARWLCSSCKLTAVQFTSKIVEREFLDMFKTLSIDFLDFKEAEPIRSDEGL
jgi:hypothetical protein